MVYAGTDPLTGKRHDLRETHPTYAAAEVALTRMQGHDPSRYAAARDHTLDVLHRLVATLPEQPPPTAAPDEHAAWLIEAMTMTVDAFAHAIGKSPRTVYRMACNGQLLVHRDGVGRGTVLIYRDQVDPANRPRLPATAKRLRQPAPLSVARSS